MVDDQQNNEPKRRYDDHLTEANDHDLLIRLHAKLDTKLAAICAAVESQKQDIKDLTETMNVRCDRRYTILSNSSFDRSTLLKIIVVIIITFGSIFALAGSNSHRIGINSQDIGHHTNDCEKAEEKILDMLNEFKKDGNHE